MGIVRRHSAYSSVITMIGFAIGAFNILIIFPRLMTKEQLGLTRLIMEAGTMVAALCSVGVSSINNKFFPYYDKYLHNKKNDLAGLSLLICLIGFTVFLLIAMLFKGYVLSKFAKNSPLFVPYYYLLIPISFSYLIFTWLESFAWGYKKSILSNGLKEAFVRIYTTLLLISLGLGLINFNGFMTGFTFSYFMPILILSYYLYKKANFRIGFTPSSITKRLLRPMKSFLSFAISGTVIGMLIRTMDTFFLAGFSNNGLGDVAIFTIATYITMVMDIPFRSIVSSATPVLANSWRVKDLGMIKTIYSKSTLNLLIVGFFLFGCIWINLHNLVHVFPENYKIDRVLILIMSITKLIDLGTGLNGHVLATSNYWKFEFFTNLVVSILAIVINGILIKYYGLMGAAIGSLITICIYNFTRFIFLWLKFGLQPFNWNNFILLIIAVGTMYITYYLPFLQNWILDGIVRSLIFTCLFIGLILKFKVSDDIIILINTILRNLRIIK